MACAYGVHVCLLEHLYIVKHCLNVNCTSCHRMGVLQVRSLEQHFLAIDINESILYLNVAETIFGREYMLFVAGSIFLYNNYCVEIGCLGRPCKESGKSVKCDVGGFRCFSIGKIKRNAFL